MDRRIQGDGTPPDVWLRWWAAHTLGPTALAASPTSRLVVVAPHPDDEVLMCGGLLQRHLAQGGKAVVIAATDGEASHRDLPEVLPDTLRATRRQESSQGLECLGLAAGEVQRLALPDGALSAHRDQLAEALRTLLQAGDQVVSTWRLDGHPDHEATGDAVAEACAAVRCQHLEAPVWMWHWAHPGQARIPWDHLHALALHPDEVRRKRQALDCHHSQLVPRGQQPPVLEASILQRSMWPAEYFFIHDFASEAA